MRLTFRVDSSYPPTKVSFISFDSPTLTRMGATTKTFGAIGITNQRDTIIFWNKTTGISFGNAIDWQDRRNLNIIERFSKNLVSKLPIPLKIPA
ncbi:FGGY family carbohydrate kinase [Anaerosinus sp.]